MATLARTKPSRNPIAVEDSRTAWVFLLPALVIFGLFLFGPILYAVWISFHHWDIANHSEFIGFENYWNIVTNDEDFRIALRNTIWYSVGVVPVQTAIGLVLAVLANRKIRGKTFFRTAFYFPSISSSVVISLIFLWIYQANGLLNVVLRELGLPTPRPPWMNNPKGVLQMLFNQIGIDNVPVWLAGPSVALMAIMMLNIWTTAGTMMVIFLAGLQDIPGDVYEAASLDGATRLQMFRDITIPLLRPVTLFVLTLGLIGTFQVFDQIFVMTENGGPAKTTITIAFLVYLQGFNVPDGRGYASAIAMVLFLIILGIFLIQRRLVGEPERY